MEITTESKIGAIAAYDYRASSVFERYHINFCRQGDLKIQEVCTSKNLSPEKLIRDLKTAISSRDEMFSNFNYWPIELLADYIEKNHHRFFTEKAPVILNELYIAADLFGDYYPSLRKMHRLFYEATYGLKQQMKKEEELLFPYIRKIAAARQENKPAENIRDMSLEHILDTFSQEYEKEIQGVSQLFSIASDIENEVLFKNLHAHLKEFEADLQLHAHLENNILFPKALELENTVER